MAISKYALPKQARLLNIEAAAIARGHGAGHAGRGLCGYMVSLYREIGYGCQLEPTIGFHIDSVSILMLSLVTCSSRRVKCAMMGASP